MTHQNQTLKSKKYRKLQNEKGKQRYMLDEGKLH